MGKWCIHASSFIFDRIIIKVAGNQDRHKSSVEFDFWPNHTTHFGVTCPWVTKIPHFRIWIFWSQLANLDQILCLASLGWGKGCIWFWGRLNQNSGFHGNRNTPLWGKWCLHLLSVVFDPILFILAGNEDMHKIWGEFEFRPDRTTDYGVSCPWGLNNFP